MALLLESDTIQSTQVDTTTRQCLQTYQRSVYRLEKASDVLYGILIRRNSPDAKIVQNYKNKVEDLKAYCVNELDQNNFQVDLKEAYNKIFNCITEFPKSIVEVAKRNGLEGFSKYIQDIPNVSLSLMDSFNKFMGASISTVDSNMQTIHEENESAPVLASDFTGEDIWNGIGNVAQGAKSAFNNITNFIGLGDTSNTKVTFGQMYDKATTALSNIGSEWSNIMGDKGGPSQLSLNDIGRMLTSPSFTQAVGAVGVCTAIYFGLRWVWRRLKRAFGRREY